MSVAILLLLVLAMSFRDIEDAPNARTYAEFKASIVCTGGLNATILIIWFLFVFALHFLESLGWTLLLVGTLAVRFIRWAGDGLAGLADPPALVS